MTKISPLLLALFFCLYADISYGRMFKNSYIQFHLPDRWQCDMQGKGYLCRHKVSASCETNPESEPCQKEVKKSREAVIVFTAKEKSEVDTLDNYLNHFKTPKKIQMKPGSSTQSKLIHGKLVGIQGYKWVDSMHLSSELPHYYTRYLSTIKGNIAVLVTFTSHKLFYTQYSNTFFKSIKSLRLTASSLNNVDKNEVGNKILSQPIDIPDEFFTQTGPQESNGDGLSPILFALAMLLAGTGVYLWIKKRKKS